MNYYNPRFPEVGMELCILQRNSKALQDQFPHIPNCVYWESDISALQSLITA